MSNVDSHRKHTLTEHKVGCKDYKVNKYKIYYLNINFMIQTTLDPTSTILLCGLFDYLCFRSKKEVNS